MPAPAVPPELKAISPYLQRGSELRGREPVVAYYCGSSRDYYAARMALEKMEQGARSKEVQEYLYGLMDRLEQEKKSLSNMEAMTDDIVAKAYIENFALKIFSNADNEDRAGQATKKTAKTFLAASMFLELLKIFGDLEEEVDQKMKYARWKTADIIKAINEGRVPQPGPPGGLGMDEDGGAAPGSFPDFPAFPDPPSQRSDPAAAPRAQPSQSPSPGPQRGGASRPPARGADYSAQKMAEASQGGAYAYDPKVLGNAQKHARFAISAIQYDDIETAVDNLKRALQYLEPYLKR
ncbi:Vta1 like-domain-containing protein [Hyaloraphidium curvatum]|nr:Vta1 like-domain-containing protein [Hyaloraphidium curvatum]